MCKCKVGENTVGGWVFLPCQCEEAEFKKQDLKRRRKKQLEYLEGLIDGTRKSASG